MHQPLVTYTDALVASISLALLARSVYLWLLPKPLPDIPHNPITSIWGDLPELKAFMKEGKNGFAEYVIQMVEKHGYISQILAGRSPILVVADRLEMERILVKGKCTDQSKQTRDSFGALLPSSMIALPAGKTWKRHRRLMGPSMNRRYLERMSFHTFAGATELVHLWLRKVDYIGTQPFDVDMDLQLVTLDAIVNIAAGASLNCLNAAYTSLSRTRLEPVSVPFQIAARNMAHSIEYTGRAKLAALTGCLMAWFSPSWRKSYQMFATLFNEKIADARAKRAKGQEEKLATDANCVLDMVIERAQEGGEGLGDEELVDEAMIYMIAGQESTASALGWLLKYLPSDPSIQKRLHDEACMVLDGSDQLECSPSFEALDSAERMPVLEAVVAETLRHAGVASISTRELTEDHVIHGRYVPKGTLLVFPLALMSTQVSDWGPDASVWRPDRWLCSDGSFNRTAGPSVPFGLGSRACFGQRLAVMQVKIYIATLIRWCMFRPVPQEVDIWEARHLVTKQPAVCYVSLEKWM